MKVAIAGALIVLALCLVHIPLPMVARNLYRRRFKRRIAGSGRVCVTFDDGPDLATTMRILDILAAAGVKATFFVTGSNAQRHPEIVRRLVAEGHEVGEHSFCHSHPWKTDPWRSAQDVLAGTRTLKRLTKTDGRLLFRPPFGKFNSATLLFVLLCRKQTVFWTIDPRDYAQRRAEDVVSYVSNRLSAGSVILLHDGKRHEGVGPEVTFAAVEGILGAMKEKGLEAAVVSEALRRSKQNGRPGGTPS